MAVIRTRKNGTRYPVSGRGASDHWIQKAVDPNDKGVVRNHMKEKYGDEAFQDDDPQKPMKIEYLEKEKKIAFARGDHRLGHQIEAAINLKRLQKKRHAH